MDIHRYKQTRLKLLEPAPHREFCFTCRQPTFTCYCRHIKKFDPAIKFVILIHSLEARRRIATGRMSHLCLENSELIRGHDFTHNKKVNEILNDQSQFHIVLFPGPRSVNLTLLSQKERSVILPNEKKLTVFVIDGTWDTANKMIRLSENLHDLPRFCFTPSAPSNFKVRKQPKPGCLSTIEAIYQTIDLLGPYCGFDVRAGKHNALLKVFGEMVEQQLVFSKKLNFRRVRT
jgi:DTW domain-containing protein YfiP